MGTEFWRTIQVAIEKDNWTTRAVVPFCAAAVVGLGIYTIAAAK
ncbi:hypothetical protein ACWDQO_27050 [Streptomyces sp. NPDC003703]